MQARLQETVAPPLRLLCEELADAEYQARLAVDRAIKRAAGAKLDWTTVSCPPTLFICIFGGFKVSISQPCLDWELHTRGWHRPAHECGATCSTSVLLCLSLPHPLQLTLTTGCVALAILCYRLRNANTRLALELAQRDKMLMELVRRGGEGWACVPGGLLPAGLERWNCCCFSWRAQLLPVRRGWRGGMQEGKRAFKQRGTQLPER